MRVHRMIMDYHLGCKARAIGFAMVVLLFAPNSLAQCKDTLIGDEPVVSRFANADRTTLVLKTTRCGTEVTLETGRSTRVLLKLEGGSGRSEFVDLNGDGVPEVDIVFGCGLVNCTHAIYALEAKTYRARKILSATGAVERIQDYFFVTSTEGAGEYWAVGHRISDLARLKVERIPSIQVCNCYDKRAEEQICHVSLAPRKSSSTLARKMVEKYCFPDTKVQFGWSP